MKKNELVVMNELEVIETEIQELSRGVKEAPWEIGERLMRIRDGKLYEPEGYSVFKGYLVSRESKFDFKKSRAYQLIDCVDVKTKLLSTVVDSQLPDNERLYRKLGGFDIKDQLKIWQLCLVSRPPITNTTVQDAAELLEHMEDNGLDMNQGKAIMRKPEHVKKVLDKKRGEVEAKKTFSGELNDMMITAFELKPKVETLRNMIGMSVDVNVELIGSTVMELKSLSRVLNDFVTDLNIYKDENASETVNI